MTTFKQIICLCIASTALCTNGFAHPGRTDSNGGHRDNRSVSGLGTYHYHHGYEAHLHSNGKCPYDTPAYVPENTISGHDYEIPPERIERIEAESISFDTKAMGLFLGRYASLGDKITPILVFEPADTTIKFATYESDAPQIIQVENGCLTVVNYGSATVTAATADGRVALVITSVNPAAFDVFAIVLSLGAGILCLVIQNKRTTQQ